MKERVEVLTQKSRKGSVFIEQESGKSRLPPVPKLARPKIPKP